MNYFDYIENDDTDSTAEETTESYVPRYMRFAKEALSLPPIDIADGKQIEKRMKWYIQYCLDSNINPTVAGLCCVLGVDRKTLYNWEHGIYRSETHQKTIKRYKQFLEAIWESRMLEGTINPIVGIFLGKNNFGYADKQDIVVTPNNPLGDTSNPEEVRQRYIDSTN